MLAFSELISTDVVVSGTWPLFLSHFHGVWTDPVIPLSVITGFCRSTRAAGEIAERLVELEALAKPLLDDVLKQLENWDPKVVAWQRLEPTWCCQPCGGILVFCVRCHKLLVHTGEAHGTCMCL